MTDQLNSLCLELRQLRQTAPSLSPQSPDHHGGIEGQDFSVWVQKVSSKLASLKLVCNTRQYNDDEAAELIATLAEYGPDIVNGYCGSRIIENTEGVLVSVSIQTECLSNT